MESPIIHAQLGHPNLAKRDNLFQVCISCQVCLVSCVNFEHYRCSFLRSISQRVLSPFVLVHSNIWEPNRV